MMKKYRVKKKIGKYFGNFLIASSILILLYIYFPFINLFLNQPKYINVLPDKGFFVSIPKISAQAPIIEAVDPLNPDVYLKALEKGVALSKDSFPPGQGKTVYLFAHSSDVPWRITKYNTIFFRLSELKKGDLIEILKDGQKFNYKVTDKTEVWPTEIKYLTETEKNQLILQTCTPVGTSLKRLLIFADPVY